MIFEQIKLGACVIHLFDFDFEWKKPFIVLFFVIQGHLQGRFQFKVMKMSIPRSKM